MADLQSPSADWPLATPWARTRRQKRRGEGRLPHWGADRFLRLNPTFAFSPFQVPFGGKVCNYIQPFYVSFYMGKKRRSSYTRSQGKREDRGRTGFFPLRMP